MIAVDREVPDDETAQVEFPDSPDTLWVLSDPLDHDFEQTVEASSVLHAIGDWCVSRGASCVRLLSVQEIGELRCRIWKSWVHRVLVGRPFSTRDFSKRKVLGATTSTIRQTNLSQQPRGMPLPRTFEFAGLTQMKPVHASKLGVMSCWKVHKKPFFDSFVSGRATALTVCRKTSERGDPKRWFADWAEELFDGRNNRAWHVMHALIDIFHHAGCYDHINVGLHGTLVSRRLKQHNEASAHGADAPVFLETSFFFCCVLGHFMMHC